MSTPAPLSGPYPTFEQANLQRGRAFRAGWFAYCELWGDGWYVRLGERRLPLASRAA